MASETPNIASSPPYEERSQLPNRVSGRPEQEQTEGHREPDEDYVELIVFD